jgi:hypothetical protein
LEVFPERIQLDDAADFQSLVVRTVAPDGITRDVAGEAQFSVENADVAVVDGSVVCPTADGATSLTATLGELSVTIPLSVANVAQQRPVSFRRDVMPVLTKAGCNTGSCHGSARGQDGFHLSLFGYDPAGDHHALTRELPGRRINLAVSDQSLTLLKAAGRVPHTGGARFAPDSEAYQTLQRWLEAGVPNDTAEAPAVTSIEIFPQNTVLACESAGQRLVVRAHYADGTDRDVTRLAVLLTNNDVSAEVDAGAVVRPKQRGEALITARFDAFTIGTQVIVIPSDAQVIEPPAPNNYIDELVFDKLRTLRIAPSALCSDEGFLRRAHIDIAGRLPSADAARAFLADDSPDKRERLLDELLDRKEFVELWVMKWAERLAIRSTQQTSYKATLLYYKWLEERIAGGVPIDRIARELLTSSGGTFTNPATNFFQQEPDTLKLSENVAQAFLGIRLQCAQCHNHPFDRWTMNDYYGFAAFFPQVGRKQAEDPRETVVFNSGGGEIKHPVGGAVVAPRLLGGPTPDVAGRDRREALAEWMTSPDNPFFASNIANFIWAHFFARGIVEPVDDVRVSNPPSNAQLLDALAAHLIEYDYDFKRLVRDICLSRTYQLDTRPNETNLLDQGNYSRAAVRRIRAEVLLDCITQVTQTRDKFRGLPLGARAVQIADGTTSTYFLTTFGRAKRETVCTCEVRAEPNLSQALHLINGETVHRKVHDGGLVPRLLESGLSPREVITQLYLGCLSRDASEDESGKILALIGDTPDPAAPLEDLFWSLLNSEEFMFNH